MKSLLSRVGNGVLKVFGTFREPLRKVGQFAINAGKFAVKHHEHLAPLIHGLAMASGNETAQKVSGGLLAASQMATMVQKKNEANRNIQAEMNKGGYGSYNHATGKMSNYK